MAEVTINDLTLQTSVDRAADFFEMSDTSDSNNSRKTTVNNMLNVTSQPLALTDVQSPTNKTFDNTNTFTIRDDRLTLQDNTDTTKQAVFQLSGISTATTRTYTLPNVTDTLVSLTATQTLTNKTLTSPTISAPTITNPTLTVDTISEFTSANGVTIDGLNIKDSKLNTANSVVASNITDGIITNAKLSTTAGEAGGVWASWTPTFTNLSGGTLTFAKYTQIGKTVRFRLKYVLTGANVSGDTDFTLPVTANSEYASPVTNTDPIGTAYFRDAGTAAYMGLIVTMSTTKATIRALNASGTYLIGASISSTVPFTWASTDEINIEGSYEAA